MSSARPRLVLPLISLVITLTFLLPAGVASAAPHVISQISSIGSLTVTKHAVGGAGTFHFTVSCDDGNTYPPFDMTVAAGDTDSHLVSDVIGVGTQCTASETANALFSTTRNPSNGTVTIDADGETVAFTNTRLVGSLVVAKSADVDATFHFDVDCTNNAFDTTLTITTSGGSGGASISGAPTGVECTVTEQSNPLFSSLVVPGDGSVTIATGDNVVSFTNTRIRGRLNITKSADIDGTFHFDVDCTDNAYDTTLTITTSGGSGSAHIDGIPTGVECTVTEQADPHWTAEVTPANGTVTIGAENHTVAFTNTRVRGALVINKSSDVDGTFVFDVDCDGTANDISGIEITTSGGTGSATIPGIPTGTSCSVTEHSNPLFTSNVVPANGTVTIGDDVAVDFTNLRIRGSLVVTKSADVDGTFHFDVDCTDNAYDTTLTITTSGGSGSAQIDGIPTGTSCSITEQSNPLFVSEVVPADGTVTIGAGLSTVAFTNTRRHAIMSLTKSAEPPSGTAVTDGDTITYTLAYANAGNIAADVTISDTIPEGTTNVDGSAGDATLAGGTLTWARTVAAGGSGQVSFQVVVNSGLTDPFTIDNGAVLHEGETSTPTNETHHSVAHITITKAVDRATAVYGSNLTYTLTVNNPSGADLTGIVVTDPMPAGTAFVSASDGGTCDDPCTTVSWPAVDLASGDSFIRTFVVNIVKPTAGTNGAITARTITNAAAVQATEVPTQPSNEVVTKVTAVLGKRIARTGPQVPLGPAAWLAIGLMTAGAMFTAAGRARRRPRRHSR